MNDRELEIELEKLRIQAASDRQQRWFTFVGSILAGPIITSIIIPIFLRSYHLDTVQKVEEVKQEAKAATVQATAAVKTSEASARTLDEKADANLAQWRAYHSQSPDDMNKAVVALTKAEAIAPYVLPPVTSSPPK